MSDKMQLLKIGDFAQFCGVTKNTLIHYENMGLIKPEVRTESGYRLYAMNQFFALNVISVLKAAGSPLNEIKNFMENFNNDRFITLLTEKHKALEKELADIKHMKDLLKKTISLTEKAAHEISADPVIEERNEQYLLVVDLDREESQKEQMHKIGKHFKYCIGKRLSKSLISGFIKSKATIKSRDFTYDDSYFCEISHITKSKKLFVKPKGRYAVLYHQGTYDTISLTYEKLLDFIRKENLSIIGNAYNFEIFGYLSTNDQDKFVIKVEVEIS